MIGLQLGTAAVLWTNNTGSPLDSQLPWQFLSQLVIHGLGLAVCGIAPQKHSVTPETSCTISTVASLATILLVTMTGRFVKAAPLDKLEIEHIQRWFMPILSAMFGAHHGDPEIGGVLVILAALVVGQPHTTLEQGTISSGMSHKEVQTGKPLLGSMHATHLQCLGSNPMVADSLQWPDVCRMLYALYAILENSEKLKQLLLTVAICMLSVS